MSPAPARRKLLFGALALLARPLRAQEAEDLTRHFRGRHAAPRLDMPGDDSGVDVHAYAATPIDAAVAAERLRKYGAALRSGEAVPVTLVKRKGDHIEFHLGGGGFTNRELLGLPGFDSAHWGTTEEERRLRSRISGTRDKRRRRSLESDYDSLRRRRIRPLREQLERDRRRESGSRFNIRFRSAEEAGRVTPEALTALLEPYLAFR